MDKSYKLVSCLLTIACVSWGSGSVYGDSKVAAVSVDVGVPFVNGSVQYSDGYPENYYYYSDPYYAPGGVGFYYNSGPSYNAYYGHWNDGHWHDGHWHGDNHWDGNHGDHHWDGGHGGDHNWRGGGEGHRGGGEGHRGGGGGHRGGGGHGGRR